MLAYACSLFRKTANNSVKDTSGKQHSEIRLCPGDPNKKPLYIIDGKINDSVSLATIMPNDIERIEVLKDEQATNLYGEKAKYGVIYIYMKKRKTQAF